MANEKRLPKYFTQEPEQEFEVLDYRAYPWGYDANEEFLHVGIRTADLNDYDLVDIYEVGFPHSHMGFDDQTEDGVTEVHATEIKFIRTDEQAEALTDDERERYDEDRQLTLGKSYLILLDPDKKQFHVTR